MNLEACDPTRNIWRSYSIKSGQDLFGDWIVAINYGRIGARGQTKTVILSDEEAVRHYVQQCLKRRKAAPKRIGTSYKVKSLSGDWNLCDLIK